jgi:hypothetical protein
LIEKLIKSRFLTKIWNIITKIINKINSKKLKNKNVNKIIYFLKGYGILNFALKKQFLSVGKDAERWIMVKFYLQERK